MTDIEADLMYANARIKELEAELKRLKEANRWIPVTEKLPDNTESYYEEHGVYPKYLVIVRLSPDLPRIACFDGKRFCNGVYSYDVTHWRPLPEPPEPEKPTHKRGICSPTKLPCSECMPTTCDCETKEEQHE